VEIASYRSVFQLERRLYRIDRLRLNPAGVPLRGIAYFIALVASAILLGEIPVVGWVARVVPWYVRGLLGPAAVAAVLVGMRVDGRPFHLVARAAARFGAAPRRLTALRPCPSLGARWRPSRLIVLPDGSEGRVRRFRYTGPGAVVVRVAHTRREASARSFPRLTRPADLELSAGREEGWPISPGEVVLLAPDARLETRSVEGRSVEGQL
jgi:hypothetical protein